MFLYRSSSFGVALVAKKSLIKALFIQLEAKIKVFSLSLYFLIIIQGLVTLFFSSCKKFVTVDPPNTQLVTSTVFASDATATAALTGIYSRMMSSNGFASGSNFSITRLAGLSADEFVNYSPSSNNVEFYTNSLISSNTTVASFLWNEPYQYIYTSNAILESLSNSSAVNAELKEQLMGEAKFVRAFCNFYLINLFGDVPLINNTDYQVNMKESRTVKFEAYQQVITDLKDAQMLLANDYSFSNDERVRPNKWAATALLARVYLFLQDWTNAEQQSSSVINNSSIYTIENDLNTVFLKNSSEAIWQLMPNSLGFNTSEGRYFILTATPTLVALSSSLINSFETNDKRKDEWIGLKVVGANNYYYSFKYKVRSSSLLTEYSMVLRLAEQYLIRAEARAQQNNIEEAQSDLNVIRSRAGLPNTTAGDKAALLFAIEHERQNELFSEWGHRWFDLIRTKRATTILGPIKGSNWQTTDVLYPIPLSEIQSNPNVTQNDGY